MLQVTKYEKCISTKYKSSSYRAEQHLHVDFRGHINVVQLTSAIAMNDVHKCIHCGFNMGKSLKVQEGKKKKIKS